MRRALKAPLAVVFGVLLVTASVGLAVESGMVDRQNASPVGESQALACGGLCIAGLAGAAGVAVGAVSATYFTGDSSVNESALAEADAQEAHKDYYSKATTQHQNNEILVDSYQNFLQDTPEVARMEGKNAYVRALENGSSEASARAKAKQAVADYYAQKQMQLIKQWEVSHEVYLSGKEVKNSHSDIDNIHNWESRYGSVDEDSNSTGTVSLVNGTSANATQYSVSGYNSGSETSGTVTIDSARMEEKSMKDTVESVNVTAPNDNYQAQYLINFTGYVDTWSEIQTQNSEVQDEIDAFVTNTYDNYQSGDITSDDLIDPYLSAREYSPEGQYGSWSLRTMTSLGLNPPENLSTTGNMTVQDLSTGSEYEGILMSDGVPESGGFSVGTTYNAGNLTGKQFVVSTETGKSRELTGDFRINNATDANGNVTQNVQYREISYNTTNLQEYKALSQELRNLTAQIESRQQRLRSGGGGGLFSGIGGTFGFGLTDSQAGAAVAFIVIFLLMAMAAVVKS